MSVFKSLTHSLGNAFLALLGRGKTDVAGIMKGFTDKIAKLEGHAVTSVETAMKHDEVAVMAKAAADYHLAEADTAKTISSKLKDLVGTATTVGAPTPVMPAKASAAAAKVTAILEDQFKTV